MKHLNSIKGFSWVSVGGNNKKLGKTAICGESFWLRECKEAEDGFWVGIIDNDLINKKEHGLAYNDMVSFASGGKCGYKRGDTRSLY